MVTAYSGSWAATATASFSVANRPYQEATISLGEAALTASSNPVDSSNGYGTMTLQYSGSPSNVTQIRVGSPEGQLLTSGEAGTGSATTGNWGTNGTVFFLQDADSWPLTINHTMAMLTAYVRTNGVSLTADGNPAVVNDGSGLTTMTLHYSAPGVSNTTMTVGSNYQTFCGGGSSGSCTTGKWVANGTQFFLHNTPNGSAPTAANVIASFTATVIDLDAPGFVVDVQPSTMSVGTPYFPTVEVDAENGFSSAVTLGAAGVPAGVSVSFAPQNTLVPSAQTGLEVVAPLTTPWSYMTITGNSGSVQHIDDFEIRNQPPQITGYSIGGYSGGTATITVNATDAEGDLSYVQINIAGTDGQGTCAAAVSLTAGPSVLPGANANGACSVVSTAAAAGNGSAGTFQITFHFDSSRFYGPKNVTVFAVEQSGANTSSTIGGINIPQNQ